MMDAKHPIPDVTLERFVLGELPEVRRAEVEARIAGDDSLRETVEGIKKSNAEVLAAHPPAAAVEAIRRGTARLSRRTPGGGARRRRGSSSSRRPRRPRSRWSGVLRSATGREMAGRSARAPR